MGSGLLSAGNAEAWIWKGGRGLLFVRQGDRYFKMTLNVKNNGAISDKVNEVNINDDKGAKMESETKANMQNVIKEFGADIKSIKLSPKVDNGISKPGDKPTEDKPKSNIVNPADPIGVTKIKNRENENSKP